MFHFQFESYNYCSMAEVISIELVKSTQDKAAIQGFVYTLVRSVDDVMQWTCENEEFAKHGSIQKTTE